MPLCSFVTLRGIELSDNNKDNRTGEVHVEGTQFYKRNAIGRTLRVALLIFVGFVLAGVLLTWAAIDAGARQAYKEARDIRRALRAVGIEYYGNMASIYDPDRPDGLSVGVADKIEQISTRTGDVILYSWDDEAHAPIQFEYQKGLYRVVYTDAGDTGGYAAGTEGDFHVYYSFEVLTFESE